MNPARLQDVREFAARVFGQHGHHLANVHDGERVIHDPSFDLGFDAVHELLFVTVWSQTTSRGRNELLNIAHVEFICHFKSLT